jgi:hypothetical protein
MYCLLFFIWIYSEFSTAHAAPKGSTQVRYVDDKDGFFSALKSGSPVIVVREHLNLLCDHKDWAGESVGEECDDAETFDLTIASSTRAIVVSACMALFPFKRMCCLYTNMGTSTQVAVKPFPHLQHKRVARPGRWAVAVIN